MKTSTITRAATPALFFVAWLLLPQIAHCFYNPDTGRWLSRDPSEEEGWNLYMFVDNAATEQNDYLGLALTAYEAGSATPNYFYPKGGGAQVSGQTDYTFDTHLEVAPEGVMWRLTLSGEMRLTMWVAYTGDTDEQGRTPLVHERVHERIDARWWNQTKSDIDGIEGKYCRKVCADIAAEVGKIITLMNYYQSREDDILFDIQAYPKLLRKIGRYRQKQQEAKAAKLNWSEYEAKYKQKDREWVNEKCTKN